MKVVSNSSILIALSKINQLHLIHSRFPEGIIVPAAVWHEVVQTGQGRQGAIEVSSATWITVQEVKQTALVTLLQAELDKGESEAIALSLELNSKVILLDERKARKKAMQLDLMPLGSVGILIWAKQQGIIQSLKQELDNLTKVGGFRLSDKLYQQALQTVGEL